MITPLSPDKFFKGIWHGKGEFCLHSVISWFIPNQTIEYQGKTRWYSDDFWVAQEIFKLSHSGDLQRTTYVQRIGPDRLHTTCDDILGGVDILLREDGFSFSPYYFRSQFGKEYFLVKCIDNAILDENGILHDKIFMYYGGLHLATMKKTISIER
jgi:hypothetical protein